MELTVGTALQGNKYVIQGVLSQSDTEIVYKANHTYLDQPVVLRSLHPASPQRDDFAQVKQQFMSVVRSQAKQLPQSAAPILDCFEEDELPFVVLKFQPEPAQPVQFPSASIDPAALVTDSPNNSQHSAQSVVVAKTSQADPQADLIQTFDAAFNAAAESSSKNGSQPATVTSPIVSSDLSSKALPQERDYEPILFHPVSSLGTSEAWLPNGQVTNGQVTNGQVTNGQVTNGQVTNGQVTNGQTQAVNIAGSRSPSRRLFKMPIALLAISLIGGCIGMGTGLALRLDATQSAAGNKPRLSLFNREQSFPAAGSWPIQENYSPQPAIEQPIYRTAPPSEYIPPTTIQTLPSTTDPLPLEPPLDEKPLPESFNLPGDTELPSANPDLKLPAESSPLPELGSTDEIPPPIDRLPPISPENLLPPTTVTPEPLTPPADNQTMNPPPLKALPNSSGI